MPLKPGDKAPDFTLLDQHGEPFSLSKSLKQRKAATSSTSTHRRWRAGEQPNARR